MDGLKTKLLNLVKDEEGLELSEYAVAGSLIVLGTVVAFSLLSEAIGLRIDEITNVITNGAPAAEPAA